MHDEGPAMVIAGPGSGKTFVITHRILFLVQDPGISPQNILVITFTKAAAKEMQERTIRLLPEGECPVFGTFHSVFYNILRQSGGRDTGRVISSLQRYRFFRTKLLDMGIEARDYTEMIGLLSADISRYKTRLDLAGEFVPAAVAPESFGEIYRDYEKFLKESSLIDFDDMLLKCHRLLLRSSRVREIWQERFKYILIDEFQDIDELQYASVKLLLGKENNLFIVGDDDQSIYRFRGAKPSIMLGFEGDFPGAARYVLDKNFRCAQSITEQAQKLIKVNRERFEKRIEATNPGGVVELPAFEDKEAESEYICREIEANGQKKIAVLTRTGYGGEYLAAQFLKRGIPFTMKEKRTDIFAHFIALDICAYFKLALGMAQRRDVLRIINRPVRFISRQALGEGASFEEIRLYYRGKKEIMSAIGLLERQMAVLRGLGPYAGAQYVFRVVGYDRYLREEEESGNFSFSEIKERIFELLSGFDSKEEWIGAVDRGEAGKDNAGRANHTNDRGKDSTDSDGSVAAPGNSIACREASKPGMGKDTAHEVVISTLHASKGLEYDVVFIPDVAEGNIPGKRADSNEDIEEERRLFYVGMTRARERLYICRVKNLWGKPAEESRFVREIMK